MAELNASVIARLDTMVRRFDEIEAELANPAGGFDQARYTALVKERAALEETVATYRRYRKVQDEIDGSEALLREGSDAELRELAAEELKELRVSKAQLEDQLALLMVPKDPDDEQRRLHRGSCGRRRRRSGDLCRRPRAHVHALCRVARYARRAGLRK